MSAKAVGFSRFIPLSSSPRLGLQGEETRRPVSRQGSNCKLAILWQGVGWECVYGGVGVGCVDSGHP